VERARPAFGLWLRQDEHGGGAGWDGECPGRIVEGRRLDYGVGRGQQLGVEHKGRTRCLGEGEGLLLVVGVEQHDDRLVARVQVGGGVEVVERHHDQARLVGQLRPGEQEEQALHHVLLGLQAEERRALADAEHGLEVVHG
jgi:hypothetical protein